ncbi:hypothetical protein GDO81_016290 [Engystomops pustulosus]|uniref:Uncharacterized protein n=1 Tax=Engystomops pustulosus TaxID=76066 RepID=A0AAV7AWW5_ENGPU|nr:hypothetical protein GDO81_016290 [Engystomops pustulosus]
MHDETQEHWLQVPPTTTLHQRLTRCCWQGACSAQRSCGGRERGQPLVTWPAVTSGYIEWCRRGRTFFIC